MLVHVRPTLMILALVCTGACARTPAAAPSETPVAPTAPEEPRASNRLPTEFRSDDPAFRIRFRPGVAAPQTVDEGDTRIVAVPFERGILTVTYKRRDDEPEATLESLERYARAVLSAGEFESTNATSPDVPGARLARRHAFTHATGMQGILLVAVREPWSFAVLVAAEEGSPFVAELDGVASSFELLP